MEREILSMVAKYGPAIVGRPSVHYGTFLTVKIETSQQAENHPWYITHTDTEVFLEPFGVTPHEFRFLVAASVEPGLAEAWEEVVDGWNKS